MTLTTSNETISEIGRRVLSNKKYEKKLITPLVLTLYSNVR